MRLSTVLSADLAVGRLANEVCPRILGRVTDRGELR